MKGILANTLALCSTLMMYAAKANKMVTVNIGNQSRKYLLYVHNNVKENAPLVISLHGAAGTVSTTSHDPDFHAVADAEGFIVAYPQGLPIYFPVFGGTVNGWDASGEANSDVDFIKAVIESVAASYPIDRNRIYCCGFSNGGMMTYALTNSCSDIFAAFASISGFPLNEFHFRHTGTRPVPFLHIHGKNDDFVKYSLMPVIVDEMVARTGANPVAQKTTVNNKYDKSIYEAGEGGFPYVYYEVNGMGHEAFTNKTEASSSSKTMWNFFKQYTLDTTCDTTIKWLPRIEAEGYAPKNHGWSLNNGTTLARFGGTQKTDANQNVYRSLQLTTGNYKLCFKAEGDASKKLTVKIKKITGAKNYVVNDTVNADGNIVLPFKVEDDWGEYQLLITRAQSTDAITLSNIGIYALTAEEVANIKNLSYTNSHSEGLFSINGIPCNEPTQKGIFIKNGKKIVVNK